MPPASSVPASDWLAWTTAVPGVELLPPRPVPGRLRLPRCLRVHAVPRDPRLPAPDLHPKTYNTIVVRILAAYALALVVSVVVQRPGGGGADVLRRLHAPERAGVAAGEAVAGPRRLEGRAAPRAGAAHRSRGHRPLRPHPPGRGGHQQRRGAGPRRHRRAHEQHPHLRRAARRLADQAILYLHVGGDAAVREENDQVAEAKDQRTAARGGRQEPGKTRKEARAAGRSAVADDATYEARVAAPRSGRTSATCGRSESVRRPTSCSAVRGSAYAAARTSQARGQLGPARHEPYMLELDVRQRSEVEELRTALALASTRIRHAVRDNPDRHRRASPRPAVRTDPQLAATRSSTASTPGTGTSMATTGG